MNLTDVYAFIRQRPTGQKVLVVEVSVRPFSEPGDGVTYDSFSDDAIYSIHIADPNTGAQVQRYDFKFSPVSSRDGNYNRDLPTSDATKYKTYAMNSELAALINAVYGTNFATSGRFDLAAVYIPDVIRVDTTTGPVHTAGEAGFNRLSFLGGDTLTNGAGATIPDGWPNGRRFGDDVVDIALSAVASGPTYSKLTLLGDNVDHNDQVYNMTFPYAGTPNAGTRNSKDSGPNAAIPPAS